MATVIWSFFPPNAASVDRSYRSSGRSTALGHVLMFSVAVPLPNLFLAPVLAGKPSVALVRAPFWSST